MAPIKQANVRWILDNSVCVVDGWGYALTPSLRTVCIGKEEDIIRGVRDERKELSEYKQLEGE